MGGKWSGTPTFWCCRLPQSTPSLFFTHWTCNGNLPSPTPPPPLAQPNGAKLKGGKKPVGPLSCNAMYHFEPNLSWMAVGELPVTLVSPFKWERVSSSFKPNVKWKLHGKGMSHSQKAHDAIWKYHFRGLSLGSEAGRKPPAGCTPGCVLRLTFTFSYAKCLDFGTQINIQDFSEIFIKIHPQIGALNYLLWFPKWNRCCRKEHHTFPFCDE